MLDQGKKKKIDIYISVWLVRGVCFGGTLAKNNRLSHEMN